MVDARRAVGVLAVACALAGSGCTGDGPAEPTPSPSPVVQTPVETSQERQQRLDYAAAEKAYRTFRAEYQRVLRTGGAAKPTKIMVRTAGGPYLATFAEAIEGYKLAGSHTVGREHVLYVRHEGYAAKSILIWACEDDRKVVTERRKGSDESGDLRVVHLEARLIQGSWKVWKGSGEEVKSCE